MKKFLVISSMMLMCWSSLFAQEEITTTAEPAYRTAVGIRIGPNSPAVSTGITVKHFLDDRHALEGMLGLTNGVGFCGLYEWHQPIASVENLQWFAGGGAFLGVRESRTLLGVAGIVGLDYKFPQIPLNISIDWKPELNLINDVGYDGAGVGLSARFTF